VFGTWQDPWGTAITISASAYVSIYKGYEPSVVKITQFNNAEGWLVGENSGAGSYNPGKWSRIDWLFDAQGVLHLCATRSDALDEVSAKQPNPAHNHSAYATDGCGGYAFSKLTRPPKGPLAISGSYVDTWNTAIELSSTVYISTYVGEKPSFVKITYYDNEAGFFVGENSGPGSYYAGKWSRIDWVRDTSDQVHICATHYNAQNESAAMLPSPSHDHALYSTTGCGGYAFSALSAPVYPPPPSPAPHSPPPVSPPQPGAPKKAAAGISTSGDSVSETDTSTASGLTNAGSALSAGAIVGIVLGALALIGVIVFAGCMVARGKPNAPAMSAEVTLDHVQDASANAEATTDAI